MTGINLLPNFLFSTEKHGLHPHSAENIPEGFFSHGPWSYVYFACGALTALYSYKFLFKHATKSGKNELTLLRQKIIKAHSIPFKSVITSKIANTHTVQVSHTPRNISFTYYYMNNFSKTPSDEKGQDPFLPPFKRGVYITNLSDTHSLVFNRVRIVKNHVLIITKQFENQTDKLNTRDFEQAFKVIRAIGGFGFYNSGPNSGGSESHKHFQVVPFVKELQYDVNKLIEDEIAQLGDQKGMFKCGLFRFVHRIRVIPKFEDEKNFEQIAETLVNIYEELLKELKINTKDGSYNLLVTQNWMMVVERRTSKAFDIATINALGFMGSFITKEREQYEAIIKKDPLEILENLATMK